MGKGKGKDKIDYEDFSYNGVREQAESMKNLSKISFLELCKTIKSQELDIFFLNELQYMRVLSKLQELDKEEYIAGFLIGYRKDHDSLVYKLDTLIRECESREGWLTTEDEVNTLTEVVDSLEGLENVYQETIIKGLEKAGIADTDVKVNTDKVDEKQSKLREGITEGFIDKIKKAFGGKSNG